MSFLDGILGDGSLTNIIEGVWSEPASTLAKGLGLAENRRIVDASDRFELWGSGNCWLVLSGTLDVLWNSPEGRVFIGRVDAGGLAFSMTAENEPIHAIAIPSEETEIVQTTWKEVAAYAAQGGTIKPFDLIETWLQVISFAEPSDVAGQDAASDAHWQQVLKDANDKVLKDAATRFDAARRNRHERYAASQYKLDARLDGELSETAEMVDRHFRSLEFGELSFHSAVRQVRCV